MSTELDPTAEAMSLALARLLYNQSPWGVRRPPESDPAVATTLIITHLVTGHEFTVEVKAR